jgi:putative transposase
MPKAGRQNVAGGIYHVTARGNAREDIFRDEFDYVAPDPNLSRGMLWLNGSYARRFNGRHERVCHVFQGPHRAELLEREEQRLEVCRYIALNPVRAGLCDDPASWPWSSYRATAGLERHPPYLCVDWVRSLFGSARGFSELVQAGL